MNLARKLRQRLAQAIASDSQTSRPSADHRRSSGGSRHDVKVSAARGPLLLESLERRQMMAGDVELLFTDPSGDIPDISAMTDQSAATGSSSRAVGNLAAEGEPGLNLVALAKWLGDQGFEFYGAEWCPFCTEQKQLFEDGGEYLPFTDITLPNETRSQDPQFASLNITQYPTWILPDNSRLVGVQSIETLMQLSNFTNPTDERPTFATIGAQTVAIGSPLHIPVDAYDAEGGPLTVTVSVANPSLLSATVLTGNRSLRLDMDGYGDMVFELFEQRAPVAAGRVATLAEDGFYDGIIFHRVVDDFVIQGGDPQGTGTGGSPLGQFDDDFHPDLQHNRSGVLSFAKSSDDTNNSQFFVTEVPTRFLDFNHSVFGQLVEGDKVREAISESHVGANDRPTNTVRINNATIFNDTENSVVMLKALGGTGTTNVTFTITDSDGNQFQEVVPVTVTQDVDAQSNPINSQPYLNPINDPVVANGRNATLQLGSVDVEGDPVQYFLSGTNANATATINATTGLVQVTAAEGFTGSVDFAVGVRAATGAGSASDNQVVTFSFNQSAVATPTSIDLRASSDSGTSSADNITNIGSLTFDITGVTPGATVQIVDTSDNSVIGTGTATGSTIAVTTNNLSAIGQGTYTLAARQVVGGNTGSLSSTITVVYDTTSPTFNTATVRTTANVDTAYSTDLVSAEEGSGVIYSLAGSPSGATIVPGTGVINWTPTQAQLGTNTFTVELRDAAGNVRSENFTVNVAGAPIAGIRLELTDASGNPINSIDVGQQFILNFYGVDERPQIDRGGIFAAFADVLFDSTLVRAVPGTTIQYPVEFGNVRRGTISAGLINELGAASSLTTPTNDEETLVASLRMEALASGTVNFISEPADQTGSEVLVFFNNEQVPVEAVNYGSTTLAIGQTFTAVADTFTVAEDSVSNLLNVLANDTIVSGTGTLSVVSVTQPPQGGTVTLTAGQVRFTPTTNFVGTAEFTYRVSGPGGVQETVPVTVTVTGVNDPPVGVDDTFIVDAGSGANSLDVLANEASTAEPGETLTVTAVSATTSGGTVTIASNGQSVNYTPPASFVGTDTFTYTLSDGSGTDTVSVTVTVNPTDNPPTAVADTFPATGGAAINEDSAQASYDVLANDTRDADNQAFEIVALGTPSAGGTVAIGNNGATLLYRPAANFNGTETVTYTIRDTGGGLATATATFNVTAINDPPPISAGSITLLRNSGQTTVLSISDLPTNPDTGEVIRFVNLTTPTNGGIATISANGQSILFTPPTGNFTGDITFNFEVEDAAQVRSGPATMTVTIAQYNERAFDIRFSASADRFLSGNLAAFTLSGTNVLNETVSVPLNASSVVVNDNGIRVPGLLPGTYTLNIPAIPFLHNGDQSRSISINSEIEEGDESIEVGLGGIKAQYLSVADWFGSAPRRAVLAVVSPGGNALFAQASGAANSALSGITVGMNAAGSAITVNATRSTTANGSTTQQPVSGSANINDSTAVQNRGVAGDMRLVLVNLDETGVALTAPTSGTGGSGSSSTTTASGEPLSPQVAAALSTNDVFVPGVNPSSSADSTSPTASGEPLFIAESDEKLVGSEDPVDVAMTQVTEELTRVSGAGDAVANDSQKTVQTFTEAVDRVLTDA
ncbi:tandem-95 repeat protein [Neorhodopirellula pilleata]|uniref:peptidylprolyl isomerase n=1 Tax=Neorhodopirellula pilleata TaxID=2714738 RepID=A0A5C6AWK9_9BACT|nr:tandem-95 repeat protein [Neorhodopirellula pilleata]TWU03887.1 putative peptidyl-prolyl cis-trans isomerase [Neorhodopirellula pilleata]